MGLVSAWLAGGGGGRMGVKCWRGVSVGIGWGWVCARKDVVEANECRDEVWR